LNKEPAGQLLNVLVDSSVAEYRDFIRANSDALAVLGLSGEEVLRKMRILTLASIGAERLGVEVPYSDIAKALEIETDEVEIWVIDGERMCCVMSGEKGLNSY
jgi:translation initiation factor 3 subunit M